MGRRMRRAALGFRMHSGWGVLVVVAGDADSVEVIERKSIVITDATIPQSKQPYHHAANLELREAEAYIAEVTALSGRLALAAVERVLKDLHGRNYRIAGAALLLASGRPLPSLAKILLSHPLIHTAEGEFFRSAVKSTCDRLKIPVSSIREQELGERANAAFGNAAEAVQSRISTVGSSIGPPWTKDHKAAALAALIVLA
jgi:hypothetical protein